MEEEDVSERLGLQPSSSSEAHDQAQTAQSNEWSMVVIRDSSIFPPINHENLHISSQPNQDHQSPSPPSDINGKGPQSQPFDSGLRHISRWLGFGLELIYSKVNNAIASSFRCYGATRGAVWSFASAAGVATAVLLVLLYMRVRRRWRRGFREESNEQLTLLVKEKDEKIIQLLHQIAQMNEVLLARHRLPVFRAR